MAEKEQRKEHPEIEDLEIVSGPQVSEAIEISPDFLPVAQAAEHELADVERESLEKASEKQSFVSKTSHAMKSGLLGMALMVPFIEGCGSNVSESVRAERERGSAAQRKLEDQREISKLRRQSRITNIEIAIENEKLILEEAKFNGDKDAIDREEKRIESLKQQLEKAESLDGGLSKKSDRGSRKPKLEIKREKEDDSADKRIKDSILQKEEKEILEQFPVTKKAIVKEAAVKPKKSRRASIFQPIKPIAKAKVVHQDRPRAKDMGDGSVLFELGSYGSYTIEKDKMSMPVGAMLEANDIAREHADIDRKSHIAKTLMDEGVIVKRGAMLKEGLDSFSKDDGQRLEELRQHLRETTKALSQVPEKKVIISPEQEKNRWNPNDMQAEVYRKHATKSKEMTTVHERMIEMEGENLDLKPNPEFQRLQHEKSRMEAEIHQLEVKEKFNGYVKESRTRYIHQLGKILGGTQVREEKSEYVISIKKQKNFFSRFFSGSSATETEEYRLNKEDLEKAVPALRGIEHENHLAGELSRKINGKEEAKQNMEEQMKAIFKKITR